MIELLTGGIVLAIVGLAFWAALRSSKRQGAAEQRADDIALAAEAEAEMREIQAEERDTVETRARMRDGTF